MSKAKVTKPKGRAKARHDSSRDGFLSWLRSRFKPSTVYGKWGIFNRYVSPRMGKGEVSADRSWWVSLNDRCCKAYRGNGAKRVSQVIRDYMQFLSSAGIPIDPSWCRNPISFEPVRPAPKDVWSLEEFNLFYATLDSDMKRLLFSVLFFYGLRVNECLALRHSDFTEKALRVGATVSVKNVERKLLVTSPKTKGSAASLPMLKSVHRLYEILGVPLVDGFVFTLGNGRPIGMTSVARWLDDGAMEAGLRRISPHCLRDSCATWLFSSGTDIRLVSRWLRHSSISVTMDCYLRLYGNELGDLGRKVDSMTEGMLNK